MPRPARGGTVLVAAPAHRRMFGDPDRGHLPTPPGGLVSAEQCAFGQVHPRDVVAVAADPAARTPRVVVAAGAGEWFVAARTPCGGSSGGHRDHRDADTGGGVREGGDRLAAGGLRGPIVVDPSVSAGLEGGEIFHRDHLRARGGGVVGDLAGEVERQFPVDLPPLDTHRGAVRVEDGDLRLQLGADLGWGGGGQSGQPGRLGVQQLPLGLQARQFDPEAAVVVGPAPVIRGPARPGLSAAMAAAPRVDGDQSTPTATVAESRSAAGTSSVAAHRHSRPRWSRTRVGRCQSVIARPCRCAGMVGGQPDPAPLRPPRRGRAGGQLHRQHQLVDR